MIWRKHHYDTWIEYSANCGPVTFWISSETDGTFEAVIHYAGYSKRVVLSGSIDEVKMYCKQRAIELIEETLLAIRSLENNTEYEPK